MKDRASSVKVGVAGNNSTRGGHILHEQKYNTGPGIPAIPDEICRKVRREPCQPEVQQESVVHLLLEEPMGWDGAVPRLPLQTPHNHPNQHTEAESKMTAAPRSWHGVTVAPATAAGLCPPPGKPVPSDAEVGLVSCG